MTRSLDEISDSPVDLGVENDLFFEDSPLKKVKSKVVRPYISFIAMRSKKVIWSSRRSLIRPIDDDLSP
ncbi:hypothetical protein COLO4_24712 [Corchorus olitorius]|uniref:Uncharacterized protein n=1 Tax=Corchorus olitorius TaxID=93759 RepID=A0A1R3I7N4_9ROSI|nr:hypothetical protein COLO4_24712 [Corchorus olitorius]